MFYSSMALLKEHLKTVISDVQLRFFLLLKMGSTITKMGLEDDDFYVVEVYRFVPPKTGTAYNGNLVCYSWSDGLLKFG